ncbi:alpha/beta hydrolase [Paenibacillus sp. GP183]|jgi:pimeloyl-ACP methyl ester carboxylesterase|uniref:alpha/beta fold hydrolase n=1 Tax=Paenibacillus sp. GP183 TaxID=1882751 RepID=UPI0008985316|nr:alpha/beta hydrolase [Paenibacillus sp. GP183]SEC43271.1 Pimeloyl-ACP methyl ester carboxylesterase [Paenibacillus sp. GP183]
MMKNKLERPICLEEYVIINGISQFLYHLGTSYDNPVMLFLHGGPGSAESLFTRAFQEKWEEIYTVVHWDQRGAGKTLTKNPDKLPTIDLLLQDLFEIIQYLKKKYNRQKIVILGHSWGSVLGSVFIRKYPEEAAYYIGTGQVVSMLENERVGYNKVKEMIEQSGDKRSMKRLESIGEYPGHRIVFNKAFLKKCEQVRKLQGKYKLGMKLDLTIWITVFKSPIFRVSDIIAFMKIFRANANLHKFLGDFNLRTETADYKVPIYYILGGNDWQAPYVISQTYFEEIEAPNKGIYIIPNAGHMTMMEQPDLFFDALLEIIKIEKMNQ